MNPLAIAKVVVSLVSGAGISKIVSDVVRNNVSMLTPIQKATVGTGAFVVGAMIIDSSVEFIDRQINLIVNAVDENRDKNKETEENKISEGIAEDPGAQTT